jgi:hypothetical protein
MRRVDEVGVGRSEIASKFVDGFTPDERSGRHFQNAVLGVEFIDRCAAARRVALAENVLKVAMKQFVDMVILGISPFLAEKFVRRFGDRSEFTLHTPLRDRQLLRLTSCA